MNEKEYTEMFEEIMQEVCDLCHHPYQAVDDEDL